MCFSSMSGEELRALLESVSGMTRNSVKASMLVMQSIITQTQRSRFTHMEVEYTKFAEIFALRKGSESFQLRTGSRKTWKS